MVKRLLLASIVGIIGLATVGCTVSQPKLSEDTNCTRLKRQYIYNSSNLNNEAGWVTSSQRQSLEDQLKQNNCN